MIDTSIQVIKSKPDLFKSEKGKPIAFFSYAVLGNLLEEQNPKIVPVDDYKKAFGYTGTPFSAAPNFNMGQDEVEKSYRKLLDSESILPGFESLVNASLKKHYGFREKQGIQELDILLARKAWKDADFVTTNAIDDSVYSKNPDPNIENRYNSLSCSSLVKMDELWSKYSPSAGRFGLKVQKEIWQKTGNSLEEGRDKKGGDEVLALATFYNRIGWTGGKPEEFNWFEYDSLFMNNKPENAPPGNLPTTGTFNGGKWGLQGVKQNSDAFTFNLWRNFFTHLSHCEI